jgi:hypothetical protein
MALFFTRNTLGFSGIFFISGCLMSREALDNSRSPGLRLQLRPASRPSGLIFIHKLFSPPKELDWEGYPGNA